MNVASLERMCFILVKANSAGRYANVRCSKRRLKRPEARGFAR